MYRVLLVAQDPLLIEKTMAFFDRDTEFEVMTCRETSSISKLVKKKDIKAIVFDHRVQGMDGIKFLKGLRRKGNNVIFFLLVDMADDDSAGSAIEHGADLCIRKGPKTSVLFTELRNALKQLMDRRRDVLEKVSDFVTGSAFASTFIMDYDRELKYVNAAFLRLAGLDSADQAIGRKIEEFLSVGDEWRKMLYEHLRAKGRWQGILELKRRDGETVIGELHISRVRIEGVASDHISGTMIDITEKKRADDALKESEARYRSLFENSFDAVMLTKTDGSIMSANPAACDMLGMTQDEIIKAGRAGMVQKDERFEHALREREQNGMAIAELTFKRKDGGTFIGEVSSTIFTDADGSNKTSMIIRDITERKKMEDELQATKGRLEAILNQMPVGITVVSPFKGEVIYQNEEVAKLFRHEPFPTSCIEEYGKWQVFNLDGTPVKEGEHVLGRSLIEGAVIRDNVKKILRGDGSYGYLTTTSAPIRDKAGNTIAAIAMSIDVTEQYLANIKVEESERKFRGIFDSTHDAVFINDLNGKFLEVNQVACQRLDHSRDELLGRTITEFQDDRSGIQILELLSKIQEHGSLLFSSIERSKNGRVIPVDVSSRIMTYDGRPAILSISRDITQRVKAEKALAEKETKLRDIMESIPEVVWEMDFRGNITYVNSRTNEMLGYAPEDLIGLSVRDIYAFGDELSRTRFIDCSEKLLPFGPLERKASHKDGTLVCLESSGVPVFNDEGLFCGYRGVDRDITFRKKMDERLRQKEAMLRTVIEGSPFGICVMGDMDKILYFNHNFCEMWRIERFEGDMKQGKMSGLDILKHMITKIDDRTGFTLTWKSMQDRKKFETVDEWIALNDKRTFRMYSAPVLDERKELVGRLFLFQEKDAPRTK